MIYATCLQYGIDITRDRIPVAPSAHYLMGGVQTGLSGETSLPGLWAVGEVACTGVHGANRLASNSLLEGLVFGMRVGQAVARTTHSASGPEAPLKRFKPASAERYLLVQKELRETMWNNVGIIRRESSLLEAVEKWRQWDWVLRKPALSRLALETRNMLIASAAMMEAALRRKESIGAHYREDFPSPKEGSRGHVNLTRAALRRRFSEI